MLESACCPTKRLIIGHSKFVWWTSKRWRLLMTFIARPVGIYAVPSLALSQRSQLEHLVGLGGDLGTVRHDDCALKRA